MELLSWENKLLKLHARTLIMENTIPSDPFEELILHLREDGLDEEAEKIRVLLHDVAWTTGSELLGELGLEARKIRSERSTRLSEQSKTKLNECLEMVKKAWR